MNQGTESTAPTIELDEEDIPYIDVSNLITEDDTPVDNQFSEKQMRLLTGSLHASWRPGFSFVAMANVGVFVALNRPPVVPDMLVTTHVKQLPEILSKERRAYYSWQYDGKVPDVAIEIVSNKKGNELSDKKRNYEHMGVKWYAVFDPGGYLSDQPLQIFRLVTEKGENRYLTHPAEALLEGVGLRLCIWEGTFEDVPCQWLRWTEADGNLILTGEEKAELESRRAAEESRRATEESRRAEQSRHEKSLLAAKLRELGVDPDSILKQ